MLLKQYNPSLSLQDKQLESSDCRNHLGHANQAQAAAFPAVRREGDTVLLRSLVMIKHD